MNEKDTKKPDESVDELTALPRQMTIGGDLELGASKEKGAQNTTKARKKLEGALTAEQEAERRNISAQQWNDLLHVAEVKGEEKEWIDKKFDFPGGSKIKAVGDLYLKGCTGLTKLPKGLSVERVLNLKGCTGLTKLPKGLSVGENLYISEDLNDQVKEDAERLKKEGKIKNLR